MEEYNWEEENGYDGKIKAMNSIEAAESAWEELCAGDSDFCTGGDIEVWIEGKPREKFTIEVDLIPHFRATQKQKA